jgi:hypothetical protein
MVSKISPAILVPGKQASSMMKAAMRIILKSNHGFRRKCFEIIDRVQISSVMLIYASSNDSGHLDLHTIPSLHRFNYEGHRGRRCTAYILACRPAIRFAEDTVSLRKDPGRTLLCRHNLHRFLRQVKFLLASVTLDTVMITGGSAAASKLKRSHAIITTCQAIQRVSPIAVHVPMLGLIWIFVH